MSKYQRLIIQVKNEIISSKVHTCFAPFFTTIRRSVVKTCAEQVVCLLKGLSHLKEMKCNKCSKQCYECMTLIVRH